MTAGTGTWRLMDENEPPQVPGDEWDLDSLEEEADRTSDVAWLKAAVGGLVAAVRDHVPEAELPVIYVDQSLNDEEPP
jgi:hypothetical protein